MTIHIYIYMYSYTFDPILLRFQMYRNASAALSTGFTAARFPSTSGAQYEACDTTNPPIQEKVNGWENT